MRSFLTAVSIASVVALTGCTAATTADPGDQQACETWSKAEQSMLQTVSIIFEIAKDPSKMTQDVATEFNTRRNELLYAYDTAKRAATSKDLKAALEDGINKDSAVYYDLAGATNERIQESMNAVGAVISACAVAGIDVASVLGNKK
jgi:hypothetical protein